MTCGGLVSRSGVTNMGLKEYEAKRQFEQTPEPQAGPAA